MKEWTLTMRCMMRYLICFRLSAARNVIAPKLAQPSVAMTATAPKRTRNIGNDGESAALSPNANLILACSMATSAIGKWMSMKKWAPLVLLIGLAITRRANVIPMLTIGTATTATTVMFLLTTLWRLRQEVGIEGLGKNGRATVSATRSLEMVNDCVRLWLKGLGTSL